MMRDAQGLPVTGSATSIKALDAATIDYFGWRGDPVTLLREASHDDPKFSLGHTAAASLLLLSGAPGSHQTVVDSIKKAAQTVATGTTRERMHFAAAKAMADNEFINAAEIWEEILLEQPRDALALRFCHTLYFHLGESQSIRDSIARVLPVWQPSDSAYGFILGQYAFGLEEMGELDKAEQMASHAIDINPEDGWAVHAMAHVLETRCRPEEGIKYLRASRPSWGKAHALAVHNGWHLGLYLIEQEQFDEVLTAYDNFILPKISGDAFLDLVDAASLLWRIELAGGSVGERWEYLTKQWMTHVDEHVLAFNDMHIAFCASRSRDPDHLARLRASLDHFEKHGSGDNHRVTLQFGRSIIEGVAAFAERDYGRATDLLFPIRYHAVRIGGSHAQRDVLAQTLIVAAERAGRTRLAKALLTERYASRPSVLTKSQLERVTSEVTASHH